jgi:hypothetical protein
VGRSYAAFFARSLPRALRPRTFNDWILRRMLFDRRPHLVAFADKAGVRDYVRATVGDGILARAHAITDDPQRIDWGTLPRTYACKATHACGGSIIVSDDADPTTQLPDPDRARWARHFIHPDQADPDAIRAICDRWLRTPFGWGAGSTHEWQYARIPPRILVEELLRDANGGPPVEYNLYLFHGRCEVIRVISDRMTSIRKDTYRPDWTRVTGLHADPTSDHELPPPPNLPEMLRIATALSADLDFVRVDLYDLGDRIVFGELTNTPSAGRRRLDPKLDALLGRCWTAAESGWRGVTQRPDGPAMPT